MHNEDRVFTGDFRILTTEGPEAIELVIGGGSNGKARGVCQVLVDTGRFFIKDGNAIVDNDA